MQTFLPYDSFILCAYSLDNKRLGKQRVECKQILQALRKGGAWTNHPAVKMWRGYEPALMAYGWQMCLQWRSRGFKDTLLDFFDYSGIPFNPPWLGTHSLHLSHKRALIYKGWCDAIYEEVNRNTAYNGRKKSELTYTDYMVLNDYVNIDWRDTWYGKQWPDILPAVPMAPKGSLPYYWPVQ